MELFLKGFDNINVYKAFGRTIICYGLEDISKSFVSIIGSVFYKRNISYAFNKKITSSRIICFQSYYGRQSYLDQVDKFSELSNIDVLRGEKPVNHSLTSLRFLITHVLPWFFQLGKLNIPLLLRLQLLSLIIHNFKLKLIFDKIDMSKYKLAVTFCDSIEDEAFFTAYCKSKGIKTASLEHGQYTAWREDKLINSGIEIRTLSSDYLLAWNQMAVDEVKKQGKTDIEIVKTGILGYIGQPYQQSKVPHNGKFGVVINHQFFEKDNIALIKSANLLAKRYGMKYYLKLHPNYSEDYFRDVIDDNFYIGNIRKGIPMLEYAAMVEFSLASSSSVFCELVYIKHPVLRYSTGQVDDKYKDVPYGLVFTSPDNVCACYEKGFDDKDSEKLFDYLCTTNDVTSSYKKFLNAFE